MKQEQKNHVSADALIQLLKGAKSIRWQLALGVFMSLVLVVCALIIPTRMGDLVQILIDYFDAPETGASVLAQLAPGLLALAGVYLLRAAISYGKMQLLNRAVSRYFTCNLRIQISDKIQRLPVSFVDHTPVGDILSRMTEDVSRIGGSLHTVLDTITGGFLQILAIAVVMFLQNWQLSLAVIAFMPVSIWLSAKIAGRSETYFHQMFKQSGELYSVVEEAYTNYATTKAYNLEEHCAKRHAEINDARRVSEAKATYLSAIVQPVIAASNSLAYIAINLLGGWLIVRQGVPVGVIVTLVLFARQFSEPLEQISNGLSTLQQAKAAARRVVDLLELPEKIVEDVPVVLDTKAAAAYKTMEKKCLLQVDGEAITAQQAASLTNKLLQLCNGSLYDDDGQMHQIHRCKLDAFDELIDQLDGQKALVFYHFRFDEEQLVKTLKHNHSGLRVAVLRDNRDAAAWNAGEIDVLLAQPASCAYGLNLQQGGHHLIWYSMPWSLELYAQGEARLYRQGQKQSVIVHRLIVKHGADELVVKALNSKDRNQNALMQALKSYIKERG